MARRLHVRMPECALRKELSMSEEMKAECRSGATDTTQARVLSHVSESFQSLPFVELRNTFPSDVDMISSFVDQLMRFISRFRVADENTYTIELAFREALANAIVHGNRENPRKSVYVNCRCTSDGEVSLTIQDQGRGFDHDTVPDPTSPDNQLRTHGRGIYLMRTLMDEVDYKQGGSVVHMRKRANVASATTRKPQ